VLPASVAAVLLAAGAALGTPATAADVADAPDPATIAVLLRSDPQDGDRLPAAPSAVRLWFDAATAARAVRVRLLTPGRSTASAVLPRVDGRVVLVPLPAAGAGDYRVVWFAGADADSSDAGAGTVSFRVSGVGPTASRSPRFTLPRRPTATASPASTAAATHPASPPATSGPASAPATTGAGPTADGSAARVTPSGPSPAPVTRWPFGPLGTTLTAGLALVAAAVGARWSWAAGRRR
jgi:methionine-rich copper-binding protein CopC